MELCCRLRYRSAVLQLFHLIDGPQDCFGSSLTILYSGIWVYVHQYSSTLDLFTVKKRSSV